jgi:poly-gamma-glutamate capsule biosynthesis protein CapA/YwtB (metallophosphatase superfamily)
MTTVFATGDLVLERKDCSSLLSGAAAVLAQADVVIGHLEVPHTQADVVASADVPATPAPPEALDAVAAAGFDVLTLAGNHVFDFGLPGIQDTRRHCALRGMAAVGAGADLEESWRPAVVQRNGRRLIVVSVNCVGPRETWAATAKPGCAYVEVLTHYEPRGANPGGPPRVHTFADPGSLATFHERVASHVSDDADIVVALHKGLVHEPVRIADYEYQVAHAAIDAGASAVVAHHAHILKGVEVYRGRPIFHGLGNFATVTRALGDASDNSPEQRLWAKERTRLFGFRPDPSMPEYPFHPESRNTAIASLTFGDSGEIKAHLIPCWIDEEARPVPASHLNREEGVGEYVRRITREAGLRTDLTWDGDRLTIELGE